MKKITITKDDIATIPLWEELGSPDENQKIILYQLEENESFPVQLQVSDANGGKLDAKTFVEVMKYKDKVLNKLLDFYKYLDKTNHTDKEKILIESCIDKIRIIEVGQ